MRIVFMGTPDFAVPALEEIIKGGHEVVAVVTNPDKPKARGMRLSITPVKEIAQKYNIPVYQPQKIREDAQFLEEYRRLEPDIAVVVAFGQILSKELLNIPKLGNINLHGSLLPKYRGSSPIQWAVINGDKKTGVTTMLMDEGTDTGDMLKAEEVEIGKEETAGELFNRLSFIGAKLLCETIENLSLITPQKQDEKEASYVTMLDKNSGKIDFNKNTQEIENLVRGLNPWPVAYFEIKGAKIKVYKAKKVIGAGMPGEVLVSNAKQGLILATKDGAIEILELQLENKKRMTAKEYLMGNTI